jgi:hypothetical protein
VPATSTVSIPRCRKKSIVASGGCVRVIVSISIGVAARRISSFASVLVSFGCSIFAPLLVGPLLSMFVSMFVLAVLRVKAQRSQAGHRKRAQGK